MDGRLLESAPSPQKLQRVRADIAIEEHRPDARLHGVLAAWRRGDAAGAAAYFSPSATYQEARKPPIEGRAAIEAHFARFFLSGVEWSISIEGSVVEGAAAAVAYRFLMAASDGRQVERHGCAFVEFCDGSIQRWREYEG